MKALMLSLCSIVLLGSCESKVGKTEGKVPEIKQEITQESNAKQEPIQDKYESTWVDINHDPNDTSELFTITKIHDGEYKIGELTGNLKVVETNGEEKAEYLSVWSDEYGAEIQFIYDSYTQHLMMRTPFQSKELKKKE